MIDTVLAIVLVLSPVIALALTATLSPLSSAEKAEEARGFRREQGK